MRYFRGKNRLEKDTTNVSLTMCLRNKIIQIKLENIIKAKNNIQPNSSRIGDLITSLYSFYTFPLQRACLFVRHGFETGKDPFNTEYTSSLFHVY